MACYDLQYVYMQGINLPLGIMGCNKHGNSGLMLIID